MRDDAERIATLMDIIKEWQFRASKAEAERDEARAQGDGLVMRIRSLEAERDKYKDGYEKAMLLLQQEMDLSAALADENEYLREGGEV